MKKIIIIAVVAALVLSLGVVAYAANNNRTSQPETTQSEQFSAEAPQMDGEKPSELPEMGGQPPQMNGEVPRGEEPQFDGNEQQPQMNGEAPSGLPEMNREHPANGGLLNDLLSNGIITQAEYYALSEAIEE